MIDKTLSYLDYTKLTEIIFHFSSTPFVDLSDFKPKPLSSKKEVLEQQDRIEAILEVIKWDGKLPLSDIPDVAESLKRLSVPNSVLELSDFIPIADFARACEGVILFLKKAFNKKPFVLEILDRFQRVEGLVKEITRIINPEGFIEDSASYELSKMRTELFALRERMKKQLEMLMDQEQTRPVLQDTYISIRNNRYVIPVKPNFNQVLNGIVHDYSHSLKTSFVEPVQCVEQNNAINVLVNEEKEEEKRILKDLSDFVRQYALSIESNLEILIELDIYHALSLFALEYHCVRPDISEEGSLEIRGAVNPFIALSKKHEAVPIDIIMRNDQRAMIISGPNAGGKTAALKTIGLLSLMAKTGMFIPSAEKPTVPLFVNVYALIGDEQDISMDLSSFTAHMCGIKDLYEHTSGGELVLIDEVGGATDPVEASALAMGIIDTFAEKGCKVVVTTHLNQLKAYGYTREFAVNVATAFDSDTIRPLYKLVYGTAGYSNAIGVARNIHMPDVIIEKSSAYLGTQEFVLNDLVASLENEKKIAVEEREELFRLKKQARERLAIIKDQRDEYMSAVKEKCNKRLTELESELEEIRREIAAKDKLSVTRAKKNGLVLFETGLAVRPKRKSLCIWVIMSWSRL
ncbi:MAG TPA: hypothetical protein VHO84_11570 [Syntrophorhabdaceae bacterium]|nr:hypothetical protein [Syntrophorhabdaceae bacterium]